MRIPGRSVGVFAALVVIGCTWALAVPRYGGPDEPAHIIRAAALADGEVIGSANRALVPGYRVFTVPFGLTTGDPACYRHDADASPSCAVPVGSTAPTRVATSAGLYPPLYYVAVAALPVLSSRTAETVPYRVGSVLWVAFVLALAWTRSRGWGDGRRRALAAASLPASAWFLFGVVNPQALEIALFALAWVGAVSMALQPVVPRSSLWWIGVPLAAAVTVRPVAILPAAVVVGVMAVVLPAHRRRELTSAGIIVPLATSLLLTVAWHLAAGVATSDARTKVPDGLWRSIGHSLGRTAGLLGDTAGSLGWREYDAPLWVRVMWWGTVAFAALCAWSATGTRRGLVLVASAVVVLPAAFDAAVAGRLGYVWQGRYTVPTALGLVFVGVIAGVPRSLLRGWWLPVVAAVVGHVATLWAVLRRSTVGADGSWWLIHGTGWHPVLSPWLLIAVDLAAVCGLALSGLAAHRLDGGRSDHVAEDVDDQLGRAAEVEQRQLTT